MRVILCAFGISRRTDVFEEFAIDYNLTANILDKLWSEICSSVGDKHKTQTYALKGSFA